MVCKVSLSRKSAALLLACAAFQMTEALSPLMKEYLARKPTEGDYWSAAHYEWSEELTAEIEQISNEDIWINGENERDDEDRPPEHDVIELTDKIYMDAFFGDKPNNVTWIITALTKKDRDQWDHSDRTVMIERVLAAEQEGKFRFAYIDRHGPYYKHF
mmetsp:Transcript_3871/g.4523  ORF Transcript_3871/g.4523 Transcript_3871/m.4523 type:complete len:159 (-) Transcript_3871:684-1160(-)